MPLRKPKQPQVPPLDAVVITINHDAESALQAALAGGERTRQVVDITRRALTLRAKGATDPQIAASERVEEETLARWLASPRRAPTVEEANRMISDEIRPLAIENTLHQLLAGDKATTRQAMKDTQVLRPAKDKQKTVSVVVGIGDGPVGIDPAQLRVGIAVQVKG